MSIVKIRAALEKHLAALTPAMPTAWENAPFAPVVGVAHQSVHLLPNTPDDGQVGSALHFERGIAQVTLCFPLGNGPAAAEARAQLVKDTFKRGTSLLEGGITVLVTHAPSQARGMVDDGRFCVPVSIRYQAQVAAP